MFHSSTQRKYWIFNDRNQLEEIRGKLNENYCRNFLEAYPNRSDVSFLSEEEEKTVLNYYQAVLIDVSRKFQPPLPIAVTATAIAYFKRFYLQTCVMDHPAKEMYLVCLYMACKVEEYNLSVDAFMQILPPDRREKTKDFVLAHELLLMQRLKFHLTVHNPYRPMEGFMIDLKTKLLRDGVSPEKWRTQAEDFLSQSLSTDVMLLYPPSQIALAALLYASQGSIRSYIVENAGASAITKLERVIEIVQCRNSLPSKATVKQLEQKLKLCRNPEKNTDSKLFKQKRSDKTKSEEDFGVPENVIMEENGLDM